MRKQLLRYKWANLPSATRASSKGAGSALATGAEAVYAVRLNRKTTGDHDDT